MMDKEKICSYLSTKHEIKILANEIFRYYRLNILESSPDLSGINVDKDNIEIEWRSWFRGEVDENGVVSIPVDIFCGDWKTWIEDQEKEKDIKKRKKIEFKKQEKVRMKREQVESEKLLYERLKEKYEK